MRLMKGSLPECAATLSRENGLDAEELLRRYHAEAVLHPGEVSPMPGIPEALEALTRAGCRHYLATHRRAEDAMALLAGCGLDHWFTAAVCPQQGFPRKPAPDMLLHLMERFHLPPEKCYKNVARYGNTSSASVAIALDELVRLGRLGPGKRALCVGFGGGLTWAGAVIEFT